MYDKNLEVDLDYPDELHDLHNDYPLAGEKIKVTEEMMSQYQLQIIKYNSSLRRNKKLFPNLGNKTKYKLQYKNLKLCLNLGLKLKKFIEY